MKHWDTEEWQNRIWDAIPRENSAHKKNLKQLMDEVNEIKEWMAFGR